MQTDTEVCVCGGRQMATERAQIMVEVKCDPGIKVRQVSIRVKRKGVLRIPSVSSRQGGGCLRLPIKAVR